METIATMEHNGIPIDVETFIALKENWDQIQERLISEIDKDYWVYEGTSFKVAKFEEYLYKNNIVWPRTEKRKSGT